MIAGGYGWMIENVITSYIKRTSEELKTDEENIRVVINSKDGKLNLSLINKSTVVKKIEINDILGKMA